MRYKSIQSINANRNNMEKIKQLRKILENNNLFIKTNPDKLHIFVDDGNVTATAATSLSYEYEYRVNLIITDYDQPIDYLMVPIISWMYINQQEFMANPELRKGAIQFEVEALNNNTSDISIELKLTERVIVKKGDKGLEYKHFNDEPPIDMRPEWVNEIWPTN